MRPEVAIPGAFLLAAAATYIATPLAIRVAVRISFFDNPIGYKGHHQPTPYLGGAAIMAGFVSAALAFGGGTGRFGLVIGCAAAMWMLGTIDDRLSLPLMSRVIVEVAVAALLWSAGHGWTVFHDGPADMVLTVLWVVGVMNAFNLMDNMDGAAASTATVSALGAGALALVSGQLTVAALCFAVAGACVSFLPHNLTTPARIFMGDGGSLPVGLLVAVISMAAVSRNYLGPSGVVVAALLVGLVILDTTLVTVSRGRGGRPLLTGGRDHLTHRLVSRMGSPRTVAITLAASQVIVCGVTIGVAQAGIGWVLLAGSAGLALGGLLIWQLEKSPWFEHPTASAVVVSSPMLELTELSDFARRQPAVAPVPAAAVVASSGRFVRESEAGLVRATADRHRG
jgi:UDP-GlcNAc:undecaprenyl-phosphate GlcNAc-1-phosphate transferase